MLTKTIRTIKAYEKGDTSKVRTITRANPDIAQKMAEGIKAVRDWAIQQARDQITEDVNQLAAQKLNLHQDVVKRKKENIYRRLKRLYPGGSEVIKGVANKEGQIFTDTNTMITELTKHWEKTFQKKNIDGDISPPALQH